MDIRVATLEEQVSILSEPRLLAILPDSPKLEDLAEYLAVKPWTYLRVAQGKYSLLFEYGAYANIDCVYEIHLVCPMHSLRASKLLTKLALLYIFEQHPEAKGIITRCTKGSIANWCRKMGGTVVGTKGNYVTLFATRAQLGL